MNEKVTIRDATFWLGDCLEKIVDKFFDFFDPFSDMMKNLDNRYWAEKDFIIHAFYCEAFDFIDSEVLEHEYNNLFNS